MPRINPDHYPDRLAFEAHARRVRAQEAARVLHAAGAWLADREHELVRRAATLMAAHAHPQRHSPR